jgi:hypothetical protein
LNPLSSDYLQAPGGKSLTGDFYPSQGISPRGALRFNGLQLFVDAPTLGGSTTPMKKLIFSALVLVAGGLLFTSCTSVPQDKPRTTTTTVPQDSK